MDSQQNETQVADVVRAELGQLDFDVTALVIHDQHSLEIAGEHAVRAKQMLKAIDAMWNDTISKAYAAHRAATKAKKLLTEPLDATSKALKRKMATYIDGERKRIAALPVEETTAIELPKAKGVSLTKTWDWRVFDKLQINEVFMEPDSVKIGKTVRAMGKEAEGVIGGIEVFEKLGTQVRT